MTSRYLTAFASVVLLAAGTAVAAAPPAALAKATVVNGGGWAHAGARPDGATSRLASPTATPTGYPVAGIDISSNDHAGGQTIDWAAQYNAGVRFAYIKATEGPDYVNPYFDADYHAAKNQGLYVGAYDYARPDLGDPVGQADYFLNSAQWSTDGQTLVPFLDIEWPYSALGLSDCWGLTTTQMSGWITGFVNEVQARIGRPPMIYTNTNWWNPCTGNDASFANLPLDIAGYTTQAPPLPAGWNEFTFWQYADSPWPGDKDVFNGSLADLVAFASPNQGPLSPAFDSVLVRTPQNTLATYPNTHGHGMSTFGSPSTVGTGWGGMNTIDVGDFDGDGHDDVIARDGSGNLWDYPNTSSTGIPTLGSALKAGVGWSAMTVIETADLSRDGKVDVVARDASGNLWEYVNTGVPGSPALSTPIKIGTGWNVMNAIRPADVNGDGKVDLVARDTSGYLWLYPGTGTSTFGSKIQLGNGWNIMTALQVGDMNGDGHPDVVARDGAGVLWLYPNTGFAGVHTLGGRSQIGTGWGSMTALALGRF